MYCINKITSTSGAPPSLNWLVVALRGLVSMLVSIIDSFSVPTRQLRRAWSGYARLLDNPSRRQWLLIDASLGPPQPFKRRGKIIQFCHRPI